MKTIIFDIDGTITDMWPMEKSVLLSMAGEGFANIIEKMFVSGIKNTYKIYIKISKVKVNKSEYCRIYNKTFLRLMKQKRLPQPIKFPIVDWIVKNKKQYHFVYVTGGQNRETRYVLDRLKINRYFDLKNSLDRNNYRWSKRTGIPFKKIKERFAQCVLITDDQGDCDGATLAGIPFWKVNAKRKINFDLALRICKSSNTYRTLIELRLESFYAADLS